MVEDELEQALRETSEGRGPARRRVYELLVQASLRVETEGRPDLLRGGVTLSTRARGGSIELVAFTSMERALAWNPNAEIHRACAPATWIFSEALRLGCSVVWINPPQYEVLYADFAALADGRVPGAPSGPVPTRPAAPAEPAPPPPVPAPAPPPPAAAKPAPAPKGPLPGSRRQTAPRILPLRNPIPAEARAYLAIALGGQGQISEAYFFDLVMPGEPRMVCLGLRIDLPPAQWDGFIESIEQLEDIPGFPDGLAACPLNDEMLAAARKTGVKILPAS